MEDTKDKETKDKETKQTKRVPPVILPNEKHYRQGFRRALHLVFNHFEGNNKPGGEAKLLRILSRILGNNTWTDDQIMAFFKTFPFPDPHKLQPCVAPTLCDDGDNGCVRCPDMWEP